jgi:tRNA A37 threonylcarbamoyladenosine dehydratase
MVGLILLYGSVAMEHWLDRTRLVLGESALEKLCESSVAVAGLGGVGSWAAEALARAGIGRLILIDSDVVELTNINRQLIATTSTIGRPKVEVARERIADINSACDVTVHNVFLDSAVIQQVIPKQVHFVVDAIDSVSSKVSLAAYCVSHSIGIISCMGAGNRLDPLRFMIADVSETKVCPLARAYRQELRKLGINTGVTVVFSDEKPVKTGVRIPGSVSYVPPVAGLIMAGWVVKELIGDCCSSSED